MEKPEQTFWPIQICENHMVESLILSRYSQMVALRIIMIAHTTLSNSLASHLF